MGGVMSLRNGCMVGGVMGGVYASLMGVCMTLVERGW